MTLEQARVLASKQFPKNTVWGLLVRHVPTDDEDWVLLEPEAHVELLIDEEGA